MIPTSTRIRTIPCTFAALALVLTGCGSEDPIDESSIVLDPSVSHYGYTNHEWGAQWWKWLYELPHDESCELPTHDPTGELCDKSQSGEVFFLAGSANSGTVVRNHCVVPAGKAIYFPILNLSNDNAGRPPDLHHEESVLKSTVQGILATVPVEILSAEFDGYSIRNLERFRTDVTEYSYDLPEAPNYYSCLGTHGVEGPVAPAYAAGYYVMLAPPAKGEHVLRFAARSQELDLDLNVTFNLRVE